MADNRLSSSSSSTSSPARGQPIARPGWPWVTGNYFQRGSQSSPHPLSTLQSSNQHSGWESRPSFSSSTNSQGGSNQGRNVPTPTRAPTSSTMSFTTGESTRHWTFTGFEWVVRDLQKLRDFIEGIDQGTQEDGTVIPTAEHGDFEVLKQSPMLGDNKYKLEIAPTVPPDGSHAPNQTTLSLYITSLTLDYDQGDYETSASMMAAIKCQDDRPGERGARPEWLWEFWQNDWVFRRESEVWECPLPTLSTLLENPRVQETNSLVICVQIHCPIGPSIPQQPSAYYVPRDLLDGLEASLDNANTGDVRFVCLERLRNNPESISPDLSDSSSSIPPFKSYTTARKRIIYAHSDILIRRSEYFATMLSSSFAENSAFPIGERKLYTVVVEEADFETIYWLLKYCYANWLLFKQDDDPRVAVEGIGAGWSARWLSGHDEWEWKTFHKAGSSDDGGNDARSATSAESLTVSASVSRSTSGKSENYRAPAPNSQTGNTSQLRASSSKPSMSTATPARQNASASSRKVVPSPSNAVLMAAPKPSTHIARTPKPVTLSTTTGAFPTSPRFPVSPRSSRHPGLTSNSSPDPHAHPTPPPGPASALSVYQIAHRYVMPSLAALALEHIMSTITPQSAFAMLLATSVWDELHSLIEDFIVDRWDEVALSPEFEQCCREVAAGEWGPEGGKTLMSVFRRLRSPNTMSI